MDKCRTLACNSLLTCRQQLQSPWHTTNERLISPYSRAQHRTGWGVSRQSKSLLDLKMLFRIFWGRKITLRNIPSIDTIATTNASQVDFEYRLQGKRSFSRVPNRRRNSKSNDKVPIFLAVCWVTKLKVVHRTIELVMQVAAATRVRISHGRRTSPRQMTSAKDEGNTVEMRA